MHSITWLHNIIKYPDETIDRTYKLLNILPSSRFLSRLKIDFINNTPSEAELDDFFRFITS